MGAIAKLFLNKVADKPVPAAVESPAFSITKVLAAGSVILVPLATFVVKKFEGNDFKISPGNVVVLALGLLFFLAVASAADVLARARAEGAKHHADALKDSAAKISDAWTAVAEAQAAAGKEARESERFVQFPMALRGRLTTSSRDPVIDVIAVTTEAVPMALVVKDGNIEWHKLSLVTFDPIGNQKSSNGSNSSKSGKAKKAPSRNGS